MRRFRHFFNAFICIYLLTGFHLQALAQEPLMAKGNAAMTLTYGASNIYRTQLKLYLNGQMVDNSLPGNFTYKVKMSNPLQFSYDYALNDYTTIGASINYYSFHLKEQKQTIADTFDIDTKGFKTAIQLRGVRYFVQRANSAFYFFGAAGVRFRVMKHNTSDDYKINLTEIHQIPETNPSNYSPLSLEAGMGLKILVTKKIGFCTEFGLMTGITQIGLFYSLKNKWRKWDNSNGW